MTETDWRMEWEMGMGARNAIGIDPDSKGFVCAYVKGGEAKVFTKGYLATDADLRSFVHWVRGEGDVIVAIEGSNGLSKPLEKALREAELIFYSFKPADTDHFRKAVLGQNKNNEKDAETVARFAITLEAQGKLENYRRVWFPDADLQLLSRTYERRSQQKTAATSRLWKLLHQASPELYLAFAGSNPDVALKEQVLTGQGVLALLESNPNVGKWKHLSEEQVFEAMGGDNYIGRRALASKLRKAAESIQPISPAMELLLQTEVRLIQRFKGDQLSITKMLNELMKGSVAAQALLQIRGVGTITASTMVAEIIDIRRFAREDSLASYSGLGMKEHSSGETVRLVPARLFNHRLKDAFMTAALSYVRLNPDSHLSGYHRSLLKKGMAPLEAIKRVARALVRVVYKVLVSVIEAETHEVDSQELKKGEGDMANGKSRGEDDHLSNMPLSTPNNSSTRKVARSKSPSHEGGQRSTQRKKVKVNEFS